MSAPHVPAPEDSKGRRWAWCVPCVTGHCLGPLRLDLLAGWEREVPWPCPRPGSPLTIVAVSPEFWADPPATDSDDGRCAS